MSRRTSNVYNILNTRWCWYVAFLHLLQDALKVGVHDKWDLFLPAVIIKAQPLIVFARQPDCAVVHLTAIHSVSLQLFI